jgi:hypothetical protein
MSGLTEKGSTPHIVSLQLTGPVIDDLIVKEKKLELELFSDYDSARIESDEEIFKIDRTKFVSIKKKLVNINNIIAKMEPDPILARNFYVPNLVKALGSYFENKLDEIKSEEWKQLHFEGGDYFCALRGINEVLHYDSPQYLELINAPVVKVPEKQSLVLLGVEAYSSPDKLKHLYDLLKNRRDDFFTILQSKKMKLYTYFYQYEKVDVPDDNKIKEVSTLLFLALLIERVKFEGRIHTLYPIAQHLLLNDLLTELKDVETLHNLISKSKKITEEDLVENEVYWYALLETIKTE